MPNVNLTCDASRVTPILDAMTDIARRRRSLPEFAELFLQIVEALPSAFETRWVNLENNATPARDFTLALQFTEPFLARVAALRALDDGLPEMISTGEAGTLESRPVCELFRDELPD